MTNIHIISILHFTVRVLYLTLPVYARNPYRLPATGLLFASIS